jgi:methylmalonyl-CoA mutase N-terminal domain/subunit
MRLTVDTMAYAKEHLPRFNTISISGYHIREAGSTAVQELAFTLANGLAYVQAAVDAGLDVDAFAPRLSFFFNAHNDVFQEVAKFRAARRMWARFMEERFGAKDERSKMLRFHAQTGGSTLTAQQPEVNLIRVALQAFSATAGGAQSLHTNGFDEALALPTEHAATLALRTQQVLAHESGITATADPFGGSWYVEGLTDELEARALELIDEIDKLGGSVVATEQGFIQDQIEDSAYRSLRRLENGDDIVVGVNKYRNEEEPEVPIHRIDASLEQQQVARTQALRAARDSGAVESALAAVRAAADSDTNLLHPMKDALAAHATVGEVCGVLRETWGTHDR